MSVFVGKNLFCELFTLICISHHHINFNIFLSKLYAEVHTILKLGVEN